VLVLPDGAGWSSEVRRCISAWAATASPNGIMQPPAGPDAPSGPPNGPESSIQPRSPSPGVDWLAGVLIVVAHFAVNDQLVIVVIERTQREGG
jgi:hypothetical protein